MATDTVGISQTLPVSQIQTDTLGLSASLTQTLSDFSSNSSWRKVKVVGRGGSSIVYEVILIDTGQVVAAKEIQIDGLTKDQLLAIESEVETMKTLRHENIVNYIGTQRLQNNFYIFLEYADRGSLRHFYQHHGRLTEQQTSYCTKQILKGLQYLHSNGIAHRDIKGANVLLTKKGEMKLADFGASKRLDTTSIVSGLKGTPHWMAPEVIKGTQISTGWIKADVWSLGCTVVEMITGALPFAEYENPMTAMYQIASGKAPPIGNHIAVSDQVRSFLAACCAVDPMNRYSVDQLLAHPFVNQLYSEDQTLIMVSDEEECPTQLSVISEGDKENPSPPSLSPSKNGSQTLPSESKPVERGELTFKSRIPILQSRAMKVNVDSPDNPKKLSEESTPSMYKSRKTRDTVMPPQTTTPQPPILTPTPPVGVKQIHSSSRFRRLSSKNLSGNEPEVANSPPISIVSPSKAIDSPSQFSDQEVLSPVNDDFSPLTSPQLLTRDLSVPILQPISENKSDHVVPPKLESVSTVVKSETFDWSLGPTHSNSEELGDSEDIKFYVSEDVEESTVVDKPITSAAPVMVPLEYPSNENKSTDVISLNLSHPDETVPNQQKKKKALRFDAHTAPNREKPEFLDDSDDSVPAIIINGAFVNSNGTVIEATDEEYIDFRPSAPLSSEKLNLCSDNSTTNIKKTDSKQSLKPQNSSSLHPNNHPPAAQQMLKPLRAVKVTRKYRSKSANPPSGPSKVLLPPMVINQTSNGSEEPSRPVSLMKGIQNPSSSPPAVPQLQLRMIQSAPSVSRSVNLPPILASKTPSKRLQTSLEATSTLTTATPNSISPSSTSTRSAHHHPAAHSSIAKKIFENSKKFPKPSAALAPLKKKETYEDYEATGGILAPRRLETDQIAVDG